MAVTRAVATTAGLPRKVQYPWSVLASSWKSSKARTTSGQLPSSYPFHHSTHTQQKRYQAYVL